MLRTTYYQLLAAKSREGGQEEKDIFNTPSPIKDFLKPPPQSYSTVTLSSTARNTFLVAHSRAPATCSEGGLAPSGERYRRWGVQAPANASSSPHYVKSHFPFFPHNTANSHLHLGLHGCSSFRLNSLLPSLPTASLSFTPPPS